MNLLPRRLAFLLLLAPSCGGGDEGGASSLSGRIDLCAPGAVVAVEGSVESARDPWLTRWYGREAEADAPAELGDERPTLRVETPSRLRVELAATGGARRISVGVRRQRPLPAVAGAPPLRAEIFWEAPGEAPRSLAAAMIPSAEDRWRALDIELPLTAGTLWLVARAESVALAGQPAGVLCWGAPVIAPVAPPELPDLILITVDTLRADAMEHMPQTRALMKEGLWAARAIAPSNWTLTSFASLWTGRPPAAHGAGRGVFTTEPLPGAEGRGFTALGAHLSFPEALREAGWATMGVHQNPFLEDWTGLSRGFERWVRVHDQVGAVAGPAEVWWQENAHRPRLLVLHWMTPHLPYGTEDDGDPLHALDWRSFLASDHTPEERAAFFALAEPERAEVRRRYSAQLTTLDDEIAALTSRLLASARDPVLLFWSDHGEELWDAGSFEHGHSFDDSVIRVPLGLRWPGHQPELLLDEGVPAGDLGLHLLHLLAESDAKIAAALRGSVRELPTCGLTPRCPVGGTGASSTSPLYRAATGGAAFDAAGRRTDMPFTGLGSGGFAPTLDPAVARRLAELGYAGD